MSAPGWTCFHCGQHFTDRRCAATHFGADEDATPGCQIKGSEHGLLEALRKAEAEVAHLMHLLHDETSDTAKAYHRARARFSQALINAEEVGYLRGVEDARKEVGL